LNSHFQKQLVQGIFPPQLTQGLIAAPFTQNYVHPYFITFMRSSEVSEGQPINFSHKPAMG
jgi:hypothetical protein